MLQRLVLENELELLNAQEAEVPCELPELNREPWQVRMPTQPSPPVITRPSLVPDSPDARSVVSPIADASVTDGQASLEREKSGDKNSPLISRRTTVENDGPAGSEISDQERLANALTESISPAPEKKRDTSPAAPATSSGAGANGGAKSNGGYTIEELLSLKDMSTGWSFKAEVFQEFAEAFIEFDKDGSRTISQDELRPLLRSMGYVCTPRTVNELLQLVPKSDELDFRDYLRMIQFFGMTEDAQMRNVFAKHDADSSGAISSDEISTLLADLGYRPSQEEVISLLHEFDADGSGTIDFPEFSQLYESYRQVERNGLKERAGFTIDEAAEMQEQFDHYDRDQSGSLERHEIWRLLDDLELTPKTKDHQEKLEAMMDEADKDKSNTFEFLEFLWLMRRFLEQGENEQYLKEKAAVVESGFDPAEVSEFRDVFESLGKAPGDDMPGAGLASGILSSSQTTPSQISISDIKALLRTAGVVLTTQTMAELRQIFERFAHTSYVGEVVKGSKDVISAKMLDFPEFLLLMSHLLSTNFANVADASKRTLVIRETERKSLEDLLQRVRDSVVMPTPNG